ncbi:TetR/AcrR family transcriptional regulator [Nocardia spumae]|uniref:TetR/AcrR family transcriptional regulator n=1 Tax=Nocardia spumae TaxID=2887190 RepID=UPI001D151AA8|nr:TetR/AcrR family transcriptional regulator [Nocardia spumae]
MREETRRDIIEAAFDCFAESGYHDTSIADIATRLGIGHGTFYRYFQNKRDIVDHVVDDLFGRVLEALAAENAPAAADTLEDYRAQVGRIADGLTDLLYSDPRIPRLLFTGLGGVDSELNKRMFGVLDSANTLTAGYLEHGIERGYLSAELDVDHTAEAIMGMLLAGVLAVARDTAESAAVDGNEPTERQRRLSRAIQRLMFDGITP